MRSRPSLAELLEFGYLDDARYAQVFTQDKRALEAWGNERIARVLRERGVDRELVETALAEPDGAASVDASARRDWEDAANGELERAVALLVQRFPGRSGPGSGSRARLRSAGPQGLRERDGSRCGQGVGPPRRRLIARPSLAGGSGAARVGLCDLGHTFLERDRIDISEPNGRDGR